jgi:hypothetical protein
MVMGWRLILAVIIDPKTCVCPQKFVYLYVNSMAMKTFKVIIAGSRKFCDYPKLRTSCDSILQEWLSDPHADVMVVSGGAHGADNLGELYAEERGLEIDRHPADWKRHGRSAGVIRNIEMAECADMLIAFPKEGEPNRGTMNMVKEARKRGLRVRIIE